METPLAWRSRQSAVACPPHRQILGAFRESDHVQHKYIHVSVRAASTLEAKGRRAATDGVASDMAAAFIPR